MNLKTGGANSPRVGTAHSDASYCLRSFEGDSVQAIGLAGL